MTTQADIDAKNRSAGRRFFWMLLILATSTSLYGNIAHAMSGAGGVSLNSIVCASIAPLFLMALVHGAAHLARNTAPVEVVRAILEAHNNGDPLNRIAKNVDRHHTAVKRIIDAAAARVDRQLAATG